MAFLVGMGDEEPLRYRILPINKFMNLGELFGTQSRLRVLQLHTRIDAHVRNDMTLLR